MQNKANFSKDQMNINIYITKDYENRRLRKGRGNKANSKPNKADPSTHSTSLRNCRTGSVSRGHCPRFSIATLVIND